MTGAEKPRIVVGVDGSEPARHALRWAAKEAELRDAVLEIVGVWSFPMYLDPAGGAFPLPGMVEKTEQREREIIDNEVAAMFGTNDRPPILTTIRCGSTATELLAVSEGAVLLVVGSRGRGGFLSMLLGSTALHCVQHAPVPVAVIHVPKNASKLDSKHNPK